VGGADKASHFVEYAIVSKELANLYEVMGFSRNTSIALGFGVAFTAGLMNEIGDGMNPYGFSFEDLTMNTLGAGTAELIKLARVEDLVGFRVGLFLPLADGETCCQVQGLGRDYSNEIYTADLHLAGVADRLKLKSARFDTCCSRSLMARKGIRAGRLLYESGKSASRSGSISRPSSTIRASDARRGGVIRCTSPSTTFGSRIRRLATDMT